MPRKLDTQLVDIAFSFDGDLFLLSENGHIYLVSFELLNTFSLLNTLNMMLGGD